jgi:hypothetical protein
VRVLPLCVLNAGVTVGVTRVDRGVCAEALSLAAVAVAERVDGRLPPGAVVWATRGRTDLFLKFRFRDILMILKN